MVICILHSGMPFALKILTRFRCLCKPCLDSYWFAQLDPSILFHALLSLYSRHQSSFSPFPEHVPLFHPLPYARIDMWLEWTVLLTFHVVDSFAPFRSISNALSLRRPSLPHLCQPLPTLILDLHQLLIYLRSQIFLFLSVSTASSWTLRVSTVYHSSWSPIL